MMGMMRHLWTNCIAVHASDFNPGFVTFVGGTGAENMGVGFISDMQLGGFKNFVSIKCQSNG
jgi:hypothetical protein